MPLEMTWRELVVRLACTLVASAIIGFNRGESGKTAGLRTTILVGTAAAIAMLQMNYLLGLSGRHPDSFVMNDLMRLPLGILTGVGFIGAGAILRREDLIIGVTTAATLWYVTVVGLCFGGGQLTLGWAATAIGAAVLWGLKRVEEFIPIHSHATLTVSVDGPSPNEKEIEALLRASAIAVKGVSLAKTDSRHRYTFQVTELRALAHIGIPAVVETIGSLGGVSELRWERSA